MEPAAATRVTALSPKGLKEHSQRVSWGRVHIKSGDLVFVPSEWSYEACHVSREQKEIGMKYVKNTTEERVHFTETEFQTETVQSPH